MSFATGIMMNDDFDILQLGEDFQSITRLPVVLIEIPN